MMLCLRFEPGETEWQVLMDPLIYGGPHPAPAFYLLLQRQIFSLNLFFVAHSPQSGKGE